MLAAAQRDLVVDVTLAIEDDDAELDAADGEVLAVGDTRTASGRAELMRGHLEELLHGDAGWASWLKRSRDRHLDEAQASDETDARRSGTSPRLDAPTGEAPSDEMDVARARVSVPRRGPARRGSRCDPTPRARISGQRARPSRVPTAKTRGRDELFLPEAARKRPGQPFLFTRPAAASAPFVVLPSAVFAKDFGPAAVRFS